MQTSGNVSDPVMLVCALENVLFCLCPCVFVFVHEWVQCTKGIVGQDRDLACMKGGGVLMRNAALLSCIHPAVRFWHKYQDSQDQLRGGKKKKKYWPTLIQKAGRKEQLKVNLSPQCLWVDDEKEDPQLWCL